MLFFITFCLHNTLPLSLQNVFIPVKNIHEHSTRNSTQKYLSLPLTNTKKYGINSIKYFHDNICSIINFII